MLMRTGFTFNPDRYNFWPIYEAIRKYYPIGITRLDESSLFFRFPGIKALEAIVVKNIHDQDTYQKVWGSFQKSLQEEIGKEIIGTTYGQAPSFSALVQADLFRQGSFTFRKELHFTVSLVGPFYTVYGRQAVRFTEQDGKKSYESTVVLTVSPYEEYEGLFQLIRQRIESRFKEYRFVPFAINQQYLEGLRVRYLDQEANTIYNALFNHLLFNETNPQKTQVRGDNHYGFEDWVIANPQVDHKWIILPPTEAYS